MGEVIVWKNRHRRNDCCLAASNLFSYVVGVRYTRGCKNGTSYHEVLLINQDGLQHRGIGPDHGDFKRLVMKELHSFVPELPNPFTGKMEVNVHDLRVTEVKFFSK